jgi:type I restriction enzyme S subunit
MATEPTQTPSGWETSELGGLIRHVIDFRGRTPKKLGMEWGGGSIPALSANNVKMGEINLSEPTFFGSDALYAKWMTSGEARFGDVVLTMEAPLGNVAQIPDSARYILSQRVVLLRFDDRTMSNTFAAHQMRSERVQRNLERWSTGTTATGIQRARLVRLPLLVPPLPEQHHIASVLDTIEEAIRHTDQIVGKLTHVKRGLLHDFVTRGIDDNGEMRDPERHPEQFSESPVGRIPRAWSVRTLGELSDFVTSGSRGWAAYYADAGALFVRIGNLTREHINLRLENIQFVRPHTGEGKRTGLVGGDLLISITADLGIIGIVPDDLGEAYINQHIALVRIDSARANSRWIGHAMASRSGQRQIRGLDDPGAKAGLNLPTVRALRCPVPERAEQDALTLRLDEVDARIAQERRVAEKLRLLKAGLVDDLVTGRTRVTKLMDSVMR